MLLELSTSQVVCLNLGMELIRKVGLYLTVVEEFSYTLSITEWLKEGTVLVYTVLNQFDDLLMLFI